MTIATGPLLFPKIWHDHYSKIAVVWSALAFAPIALVYGASTAAAAFVANVGGALHGVDFFWTAQNLWSQTLIVAAPVLTLGHLE